MEHHNFPLEELENTIFGPAQMGGESSETPPQMFIS
jgi:hypothetical protein